MARPVRGVLAVEGKQTGDGRFIVEGASVWRDLPIALKPGHDTEDAIGNIATIERVDNELRFTGVIDDEGAAGAEVVRKLEDGTAPGGNRWGVSIEPDDLVFEIITKLDDEDTLVAQGGWIEDRMLVVASGARTCTKVLRGAAGDGEPEGDKLFEGASDDEVMRVTRLRISAAALVPVPAFADAFMELDITDTVTADDIANATVEDLTGEPDAVAAAVAIRPPRAWFYEPEPHEGDERLVPQYDIDTGEHIGDAVPLHIGDDGQVYGHVAPAHRCHVGYDGVCITPPHSPSAYAHFHVGYTVTDDGEVATGALVAGCDHAAVLGLDERSARDWYANNGLAWANVRVTPGRYGPWMCGALRPGVSDELIVALRGGGVSGDWRGRADALELIGILAVNVPGFTVQRASGGTIIPTARAAMYVLDGELRVITAPVLRASASPECGCHDQHKPLSHEPRNTPSARRQKARVARRFSAR